MKQLSVFLIISLIVLSATSQQRNCGTMQYLEFLQSKDPQLKDRMANNELKLQKWIKDNSNPKSTVLTIPVVVHVVWNTNAENISDSQIFSQMDVLNEDFRRNNNDASNTPSVWQNIAADCEIEFCLATIDPNGASTTGITRTQTSQTSFSISNDAMKSSSSGGIDPWDQDDYLNIWVCDLSGGILGYATLPSNFNNPDDGVVIGYKYFGTIGTVQSPYNKGRTATHEVGHWLNLEHIWGCNNGDNCNDTPVSQGSNYGCPNFPSLSNCNGNNSPNGDMFMNYMDYTNDACMNLFTNDQKNRMISAINQYRSNLLSHNLCSGTTNPSSWECINGSCIDPGTGTGNYSSYNACFSACECAGNNPPPIEGFQNGSLSNGWSIDNPDGDQTWVINSNYGYNSSSSISIENSIYSANGEYDDLSSPIINFSNASNINLSFDYAYSLWTDPNSSQIWSDTLIILVSSDCGLTWQNIWEEAGLDLVTTNPVYNEFEWFPSNNSDWNSASINLNSYLNQDGIIIKFRNINQYENNLFLDNINISSDGSTYINEDIQNSTLVYPNPADKNIFINHQGLKQIYNILGERVFQTYDDKINISSLSKGVYVIKVGNTSIRLIKN